MKYLSHTALLSSKEGVPCTCRIPQRRRYFRPPGGFFYGMSQPTKIRSPKRRLRRRGLLIAILLGERAEK